MNFLIQSAREVTFAGTTWVSGPIQMLKEEFFMKRFSWVVVAGLVVSLSLVLSLSLGAGAAQTIELTY
jgi:hypothetical protein